MVYTRSSTPRDYFKRGMHLLYTGILLNFFRCLVTLLASGRIFTTPDTGADMVLVFGSDILYFAGLAFLLMALLRRIGLRYRHILILSVPMSAAAYFLEGVDADKFFANQALGHLWGNSSESYFPLLNWFAFVAAGCWFGKLYLHLQNKAWFHRICFPAGLLVTAAYLFVCFRVDQHIFVQFDNEVNLPHRMLPDTAMTVLCNVWLISLFYYISRLIPERFIPVLTHPSRYINQYYCISWFLVMLAYYLFFYDTQLSTDGSVLAAWGVIMALTLAIVLVYNWKLKRATEAIFGRHHAFWVVLVVVLTTAAGIYGYYLCDGLYPTLFNGYDPWSGQ